MENPYANVLHLSLFHFFWISIYHCALSFFLFQDILFARLIASLSGWFLFFWSQTFLFLCIMVNMIFCFSMFYYPYYCLIFIILLTLWKISWMFENKHYVKLFTSKHEKPKTCYLERYKVRIRVIILLSLLFNIVLFTCMFVNQKTKIFVIESFYPGSVC